MDDKPISRNLRDSSWRNYRKLVAFREYFIEEMDDKYLKMFTVTHWKAFVLTWPLFKSKIIPNEDINRVFERIEMDIEAFKERNGTNEQKTEENEDNNVQNENNYDKFFESNSNEPQILSVKEQIKLYQKFKPEVTVNKETTLKELFNDPLIVHRKIRDKCPDLYNQSKSV